MRNYKIIFVCFFLSLSFQLYSQPYPGQNGKFFLIGGGTIGDDILQKFESIIGGVESKIVLVPTAFCWKEVFDDTFPYYQRFIDYGFKNIEILHTRDTVVANSKEFGDVIKEAKAIFFSGGCPECITASYLHTNFQKALVEFRNNGGIIAGTSAGTEAMGPHIEERCEGEIRKSQGLALIDNAYFAVHIDSDKRYYDNMIKAINELYSDLYGIGISEGTAIWLSNNRLEVIGPSKVIIHTSNNKTMAHKETILIDGQKYILQ